MIDINRYSVGLINGMVIEMNDTDGRYLKWEDYVKLTEEWNRIIEEKDNMIAKMRERILSAIGD